MFTLITLCVLSDLGTDREGQSLLPTQGTKENHSEKARGWQVAELRPETKSCYVSSHFAFILFFFIFRFFFYL